MKTCPGACTVPKDLAELNRFGVARPEVGQKVPYRFDGSRRASTTNPRDWGTLDQALETLRTGRYSWLAWAFFEEDGFVGIDVDDCLTATGELKPWARGVVERFSDTYMEISPSVLGVKIWARGKLPANVPGVKVGDGSIEMYSKGRYFTMTCRPFRGAPLQVEDHAADIRLLYEHLTASRRKTWPLQPLQGGRIPFGTQHNVLVSIAGTLRARRVCDQAIEACLVAMAQHQCERPMEREHIVKIVRSSRSWVARA